MKPPRAGKDADKAPKKSGAGRNREPDAAGRLESKGRPTPKRREAEQRNRRPLVGGGRAAGTRPGASRAERKAARKERRRRTRQERLRSREALITGDEAHLPPRDQGPARRFARHYVDARRNLGEYFMPFALIVLFLSLIRIPMLQLAGLLLLYGTGLAVAIDCYRLRRRVNRLAAERFGERQAKGAGTYAMSRALQLRRSRLPRPQVERGEFPE
ncbi:MAG: hypothetical protein QG608_2666 [Actinomycetota bacterium]|nr:hypothetical protein [Actinomycetota bacterium]